MLFLQREEGQGLVEYALVLVLVAIVVIAILTLLGPAIAGSRRRLDERFRRMACQRVLGLRRLEQHVARPPPEAALCVDRLDPLLHGRGRGVRSCVLCRTV